MYTPEGSPIEYLSATQTVEVPTAVDFVYIMRKDTTHVAAKLTSSFPEAQASVATAYEQFTSDLSHALATAFASKGNIKIHLFDAEPLEAAEFKKAGVLPIISLDPLLEEKVSSFRVSRGFYQGGIEDFGQIARPGSEPLDVQAQKLAQKFGDCPVCVIEDDIFSGGSVISALEHLQKAGVKIAKLIPGFQIGKPTKLDAMGIPVDPVITYKTADNTDIFAKVDLGDPRDYLLGASGLVVKLSDGSHGRVPYVLPFVSTSARASVPKENEILFAKEVWRHNLQFFHDVQTTTGQQLLLQHMDPDFVRYMFVEHKISGDTPMETLVSQALDEFI